jgi:hypothetical protein
LGHSLSKPILLEDGRRLATLQDAADVIHALPLNHRSQLHWEYAAQLLMKAGRHGATPMDRAAAEVQLLLALEAEGLVRRTTSTPS